MTNGRFKPPTAILIRLINEPLVPKYNLKHIKQFNTGAAPLSPEVIQKLAGKFPGVGIKQGWGMTESTSCITSTPPELLHYRYAHTVGVAVPNTVLKIVNPETGEEVGANVPGEVRCRRLFYPYKYYKINLHHVIQGSLFGLVTDLASVQHLDPS